ncbi:MAG: NfeD family protein [Coriobacteriia bacterium]|nr:NfeD family protein [Coriobacteriia bacterium]
MNVWVWVWAALAAALIVGEMFTAGFFLLPFGIGAAVAAVLTFFDAAVGWQWLAFLGVSALMLFSLRRFSDKVTHEPPEKMGADRLIGKQGTVIEDVEPGDGGGRIRIEREEWRADATGIDVIPTGSRVIVDSIVGTHLIVHRAGSEPEAEE